MIIGICGFIGSGKDTIADYLVNFHEFRRESFASSLKDAVSAVFGWDRDKGMRFRGYALIQTQKPYKL